MLRQAGWEITHHRDLTVKYRVAVGRMLEKLETYAEEIANLFGDDDAAEPLRRHRAGRHRIYPL